MSKKSVIFDMDGTLADTWSIGLEIARDMKILDERFTEADIERIRNLPVKAALKELHIPLHRVPSLLIKVRAELTKHITRVPVIPNIEEAVKQLQAYGMDLYVMSSNSLENVHGFLGHNKIDHYFTDIQGGVGVFAKTKSLKRLLKSHRIDIAHAVYVGDEVRDIEAAKKTGIASVAVTWGLNGERILNEYKPTLLVRTPEELAVCLAKWGAHEDA